MLYAALILLILLDGRVLHLTLPPELRQAVAERLGAEAVTVGSVSFQLGNGAKPAELALKDLQIGGAAIGEVNIPRLSGALTLMDGLDGAIRPREVELAGVRLALRRQPDGALDLLTGDGAPVRVLQGGQSRRPPDLGRLFRALARAEGAAILSGLQVVALSDLTLDYRDAATGKGWHAQGAAATLRREDTGVSLNVTARMVDDGGHDTPIFASIRRDAASGQSRYAVRFENARPADIADRIRVLGWLRLIEAPVSGALALEVGPDRRLGALSGVLEMGAGAVNPMGERRIGFDGAKAYFSYDPDSDQFTIDSLIVDTSHGGARMAGLVIPERDIQGAIAGLVGQMQMTEVSLAPSSYLAHPEKFPRGSAVARVRFDPFRIDIGEVQMHDGSARVAASGWIEPRPTHWALALDARVEGLSHGRALGLWPQETQPRVRRWLAENIRGGEVTQLDAFLRQDADGMRSGVDFAFDRASVRLVPGLPDLVEARGTGQILQGRLDVFLDAGHSAPGPGGGVDVGGSRFTLPDIRTDDIRAHLTLRGRGAAGDILALIEREPLALLAGSGVTPDSASGWAEVTAEVEFPLRGRLRFDAVTVEARATLSDVASDTLVPGRSLRATRLDLRANNEGLAISGPVSLDGVPAEVELTADLGADRAPPAVTGQMALTPLSVAGLGLDLPEGLLAGEGRMAFALVLDDPEAPRYRADIALAGAELTIAPLGWRKPADGSGTLQLAGRLGKTPTVERIRLDGPGLTMEGALTLGPSGVVAADLDRLRLGQWLDASVSWRREGAVSVIAVRGGRIDLRDGVPGLPGGESGPRGFRLSLAPDQIRVAEGITLTDMQGEIASDALPAGRFRARVNGQVPIDGVVRESGEVFITAENGGAALRAAGIFDKARGGTLRVSVVPGTAGAPIEGVFSLQDTRVIDAPALAQLISLVPVFSIVDRLKGNGIGFDDVQGRYRIAGSTVHVGNARAVGPSLGVTLHGDYDMAADRLGMEGVVSPLYSVNGLIERMPGLGRILGGYPGEGLIGAAFDLRGSGEAPQVRVNPLSLLAPGAAREIFASRARAAPGR